MGRTRGCSSVKGLKRVSKGSASICRFRFSFSPCAVEAQVGRLPPPAAARHARPRPICPCLGLFSLLEPCRAVLRVAAQLGGAAALFCGGLVG